MNDITVSGLDGNQVRRLRKDRRWDAEAVLRVNGSPCGTEFELEIIADPVNSEPVDRPQASPAPVGMQSRKSRSQAAGSR